MNTKSIIIALIAAIKLTTGCTTIQPAPAIPATNNYQLLPIADGLFRFNKESGETEYLVQSSYGMVWIPVIEATNPIPIDLSKNSQSH